jgi:hypothetical protein
MPAKWVYVSCPKFTVLVGVDAAGRIATAPAFVRRFVGQFYWNLSAWALGFSRDGELRVEVLGESNS